MKPLKLLFVIAFHVQNSEDDHSIADERIENLVRKPARDDASKFPIIKRMLIGVLFQLEDCPADFN